jgi:hypothetical protein
MKAFVAIPTLSRADLLVRNRPFLESVKSPDLAIVIDNGNQKIDIDVPVYRPNGCMSVSGSWNYALRRAFVEGRFDLLVLLNDDIIWDSGRLKAAKHLVAERGDVDLFLSFLQFSVQVHRPSNLRSIGYYDNDFPAYCNDDDYAIRLVKSDRTYERFQELDPLPGSISEGTPKAIPWKEANRKLFEKWGAEAFGINIPYAPYYRTNRGVRKFSV